MLTLMPVDDDNVIVGAFGHAMELPADPGIAAVVEKLNKGDATSVGELLTVAETAGSGLDEDALRELLGGFAGCRAIKVVA